MSLYEHRTSAKFGLEQYRTKIEYYEKEPTVDKYIFTVFFQLYIFSYLNFEWVWGKKVKSTKFLCQHILCWTFWAKVYLTQTVLQNFLIKWSRSLKLLKYLVLIGEKYIHKKRIFSLYWIFESFSNFQLQQFQWICDSY